MGALYRLNQLARIAQQIAALGEGPLLPSLQSGRSSSAIWNSKLSMRRAFSASSIWRAAISRRRTAKRPKAAPVFLLQRSRFSESIQILQVAPLVQELLAVVLPVDIEELPAQLP